MNRLYRMQGINERKKTNWSKGKENGDDNTRIERRESKHQ